MHKSEEYRNRIELLQGTLDLIILQTLRRGPQHGYGISQAIKATSKELFVVDTGLLYPALHRFEKQGFVKSGWDATDKNQRANLHRLTVAGKRHLSAERSKWDRFVDGMAAVMKPKRADA
jgi:PadR family transcriptional regulator, regulatory protein PadR